jgi:hypothetical protein
LPVFKSVDHSSFLLSFLHQCIRNKVNNFWP